MPTFRHAKNTSVYYGAYDLSTSLRSASMPLQTDTAETTAFRSTVKTHVVGQSGATAEIEGMFAFDAVAKEIGSILEDYAALETPIPFALALGLYPVPAGSPMRAGLAYESNVNYSGSVSDIVGISASLQLSDTAGPTIALQNPDTDIALTDIAVNGAAQDYSALRVGANTDFPNGGICCVHVLENSVDDVVSLVLQSQDGVGGYVDINSSPFSIPANTIGYHHEVVTDPVDDDIRWSITATGTGTLRILAYFIPKLGS